MECESVPDIFEILAFAFILCFVKFGDFEKLTGIRVMPALSVGIHFL